MKKKAFAVVLASACAFSAVCAFSGCDFLMNAPDYAAWSRKIVDQTVLSSVRVEETEREHPYDLYGEVSQGSGVIFYTEGDYYYALTNNHVVYKNYPSGAQSVEVVNCYDTKHTASILYQDADYDLAILTFSKKNHQLETTQLHVTPLATANLGGMKALAAVGSPNGRHNATTFGKVLRYETVQMGGDTTAAESNVQFPVLVHNAYALSGSSGGLLIDEQLRLVGIHYACGYSEDEEFVEGYAIPAEKIIEFLQDAEEATGKELGV